ncbi:MAG: DNA repair exonuclease [Candidatus Spechtbacterales bacterium]|nr:DNA repair exonuclease [Candidatus Spechtbacterales bacterium]
MRFLHTSDIHLGAKFEVLGDKAPKQREQIKKTFSKIVDIALEKKVDLFLLAGDLFDSNHPSQNDIEFAQKEFSRLTDKGVRIALIPGNHDYELGDTQTLGKNFDGLEKEGLFLFTDAEGSKTYFEDINTEVYAKSNTTNKSTASPMVVVDDDRDTFKIVMAHGGVVGQAKNPSWPIQPKEIEKSGADYVALGDWHSLREESQGDVTAYYPGSPEMISIRQIESGYIILGEFSDGNLNVEPLKVGEREVSQIEINLGDIKNKEELKERIAQHAGEDVVCLVSITGVNSNKIIFNTDDIEEELGDNFWRLKIDDTSRLPLEDLDESDYPSMFISGQFVQLMKKKIKDTESEEEKALLEEALNFGLLAFKDPDVIQ